MEERMIKELGYSPKWLDYGFLNKNILKSQIHEYGKGEDLNTEHYRYRTFLRFMESKESLSDLEIEHFVELASEDGDRAMAGSAVKMLFFSPILSEKQYQYVKSKLAGFGEWTKKVIVKQDLLKRLDSEGITFELFLECWEYKVDFEDNSLVKSILEKTEDSRILKFIAESKISKKIKLDACRKLNLIRKKQK